MEVRRKRGREYSENEGWKKEGRGGGCAVETRNGRREKREGMYSRNEGWNRRGRWGVSTAELRDEREEEEGEGVQQRREMGLFKDSNISNYSLCIMRL